MPGAKFIALSTAVILGCLLGGALLSLVAIIVGGWAILRSEDWPLGIIPPAVALAALSLVIAVMIRGRILLLFPLFAILTGFVFGPVALILVYFALGGSFNGD